MRTASFTIWYAVRSLLVGLATCLFLPTFLIVRVVRPSAGPRLLRAYLQWCGGGFVKLGQILAMRFDMLPGPYYRELLRLLDDVPALSPRRVEAILAEELGPRRVELRDVDPRPLGSASIAQVHGATLVDGTEVVVKVMRPGVAMRMRIDLLNLYVLARVAHLIGFFGGRDVIGLVDEVGRLAREELDFRREAFQIDLMRARLAADALDHRAPQVYFAYSTGRVITMERFRGVWLRELIGLVERDERTALAALAERGIEPRRTARLLLHSILTQCLVHGVFHADPHAGNVVVLDGGTLGFIDFGMLGRLDERLARLQLRVIEGIAREDYNDAYVAMLATIEPLTMRDLGGFQAQVQELFATWRMTAAHPAATVAEKSSGLFFLRVADLVRRARLRLPARMMRYYRAQIVCDMAIYGLAPNLDPTGEFRRFFVELHRRELARALDTDAAARWWRTALVEAPRAATELVRWAELRLPRLGEAYGQQLSGLERAVGVLARNLQRGMAIAAVIVAIYGLRSPAAASTAWFPWWAWVGGLVGVSMTLGGARAAMEPDR